MNDKDNIMFFESDEEFTDFCMAPYASVKRMSDGTLYVEGNYSDEYLGCIEQGVEFVIKDEDSKVYERQRVCKRVPIVVDGFPNYNRTTLVQLSVENLKPYFDDLY